MNLIPWRRGESLIPTHFAPEELWNRFLGNEDVDFGSHLPEAFRSHTLPAVNIAETEGTYCITMDCPGLDESDFHVESMGRQLIIGGERKWEKEKKDKEFRRVESQYGKFERTVTLPENAKLDADKIDAKYEKGVLKIEVPKVQKTPSKKIPVHAG